MTKIFFYFIELSVRKFQELKWLLDSKYELRSRHLRQKPDFREKFFL